MNKKTMGIIGVIALIGLIGISIFFFSQNDLKGKSQDNDANTNESSNDKSQENLEEDKNSDQGSKNHNNSGKVLVVYYSATNNTKRVAEKIAKNLNGDIFEIVPKEKYTAEDLDWTNNNSRVSKEHDDESLRNVELETTKVNKWDSYDTVTIGYPIWWGVAAWPVNTFVKANDFKGKTVIPFCTSASSGLGQSGKLLEDIAKSGNWLKGQRFSSNPTDSDIKAFTDQLK